MPDEVFLSYVRENGAIAERLAQDLEAAGASVWLDRTRLAPGDRWRDAIRNAIRSGHLFIACFSRDFATRDRSHMNEELTLAIEELRLRPTDRTWFIPVVIDNTEVPDRDIGAGATLRDLQWVDLSSNWTDGVASIVKVALQNRPSQTNSLSKQASPIVIVERPFQFKAKTKTISVLVDGADRGAITNGGSLHLKVALGYHSFWIVHYYSGFIVTPGYFNGAQDYAVESPRIEIDLKAATYRLACGFEKFQGWRPWGSAHPKLFLTQIQ